MPQEVMSALPFKKENEPHKKEIINFFFELIKWILGTFVLGMAGILINKKIQETELDIKRMEADSKLLEVVTKNAVNNDSVEYRYLSFVKTFITTDSIKKSVEIRRIELLKLINDQALTKSQQNILNAEQRVVQELTSAQKNELKKFDSTLKLQAAVGKPANINELKEAESKIAGNVSSIDSGIVENLNTAKKTVTPAVIENKEDIYVLINNSQTKWCKEGYYVEFNNTLRIGINDLSVGNQTITVNFKDIENGKEERISIPEKETAILNVGQAYTLNYKNYRYQITLNYIGAAGRNYFTKAAYITVATYKRQ